jgi:hypothetical protein
MASFRQTSSAVHLLIGHAPKPQAALAAPGDDDWFRAPIGHDTTSWADHRPPAHLGAPLSGSTVHGTPIGRTVLGQEDGRSSGVQVLAQVSFGDSIMRLAPRLYSFAAIPPILPRNEREGLTKKWLEILESATLSVEKSRALSDARVALALALAAEVLEMHVWNGLKKVIDHKIEMFVGCEIDVQSLLRSLLGEAIRAGQRWLAFLEHMLAETGAAHEVIPEGEYPWGYEQGNTLKDKSLSMRLYLDNLRRYLAVLGDAWKDLLPSVPVPPKP